MTKPKHPSIEALMEEYAIHGEKPADVIRRKCRKIISTCKKLGWSGPPYNVEILASILKFELFPTTDIIKEGFITCYKDRFKIYYRTDRPLERKRFTICHEITHALFPDCFAPYHSGDLVIDDKPLEKLCDIGAAELLMPYEDILNDLSSEKLILKKIFEMHKRYIVSFESLTFRITELTDKPIAFAFLDEETILGKKRYRIRYQNKSKSFRQYFPSNKILLSSNTIANIAKFEPYDFQKYKETLYINSTPRGYYVEPLLLESINNSPCAVLMLHSRLP